MRKLATLFLALLAVWFATPAHAVTHGRVMALLASQTVSTAGGAVTAPLTVDGTSSGYLVVVTSGEVATASLVIEVKFQPISTGTAFVLCDLAAITINTTEEAACGISDGTAGDILNVDNPPIPANFFVEFTVSGGGASFTVEAVWIPLNPGAR